MPISSKLQLSKNIGTNSTFVPFASKHNYIISKIEAILNPLSKLRLGSLLITYQSCIYIINLGHRIK
jgi:hypothetical protein